MRFRSPSDSFDRPIDARRRVSRSSSFEMPNFKLTVSYDGSAYAGWQIQANGNTVQAELERAIAQVTQQSPRVTGSGRTDAGVHALAQVASFEVDTSLPASQLHRALNGNLPLDIRVLEVEQVSPEFHALRSAIGKRYRYVLQDGPWLDVFHRQQAWFVRGTLDLESMERAACTLRGRHDFRSFEASGSPRASSVRTIRDIALQRPAHAPQLIWFEIEADGFLYNMVRNIVGTLVEVGRGRLPAADVPHILAQQDRTSAGPTAPAHGLFLLAVRYDEADHNHQTA